MDFPRKHKGFSLLNIMITVTLMAVFATAGFQSFRVTRGNLEADSHISQILGAIQTARANAFAGKRCPTSEATALYWAVKVSYTGSDKTFKLLCIYDNSGTETEEEVSSTTFNTYLELNALSMGAYTDSGKVVTMAFSPDSYQARIKDSGGVERDDVKILLLRLNTDRFSTICMNRFSAFPTLNERSNECAE